MLTLREVIPNVRNIWVSNLSILERRAFEIRAEIKQGSVKNFREVLDVSYSDSHSKGIKPLTFVRQVLATCVYPALLHDDTFPLDVRERAQRFLEECEGGSIGSYSDTYGYKNVRNAISQFITRRDGTECNPDNIIIMNGSQHAFTMLLKLLVSSENSLQTGVLTPVPSYHRFNQALLLQGAVPVPYYLCEDQGWSLQIEELRRAVHAARGHCSPMALYVINPGNPSGHVQGKESIEDVIRFAAEERLILLADEVYQSCVFDNESEFYSYKRVLSKMGAPYSCNVELASFHSVSKGIMGECGLRGGYVEIVNLDPLVWNYAFQLCSISSVTSVPGQIALDIMANPPQPGDLSYPVYAQEAHSIRSTIRNNVRRTLEVVCELPAVTCQPIKGGTFAFLRLHLSQAAIKYAEEKKLQPDLLYSLQLLEETGLYLSPGCKFGQKAGTHHIRISLACQEAMMEDALQRLKSFHLRFIKEFP